MDVTAFIIGLFIGIIFAIVAFELGLRRIMGGNSPTSKRTSKWNINEIANPRIMAEYLMDDLSIPKGAKVVVNKFKDESYLKGADTRLHGQIRGNYIIGDDRALILSGPIRKDEVGIWTVDKDLVGQLNAEFNMMWSEGDVYQKEEKK